MDIVDRICTEIKKMTCGPRNLPQKKVKLHFQEMCRMQSKLIRMEMGLKDYQGNTDKDLLSDIQKLAQMIQIQVWGS